MFYATLLRICPNFLSALCVQYFWMYPRRFWTWTKRSSTKRNRGNTAPKSTHNFLRNLVPGSVEL